MIKIAQFRVQNYRNIDDSGWIPVESVTCFVGRNESGKTALLKALHKFNPAASEPYDPQREFPRDRYTRDYVAKGSEGSDWPVCSVEFVLPDDLKDEISALLEPGQKTPSHAVGTRHYDGSLLFEFDPKIHEEALTSDSIVKALETFAARARRLKAPTPEQDDATGSLRAELAEWATGWRDKLKDTGDLRSEEGAELLYAIRSESEEKSSPQTADIIETLQAEIAPVLEAASSDSVLDRIEALVEERLPVFIYFENYGVLDSAIWLPRFLEDLDQDETDARVRTINAMFRHVGLDPQEIKDLDPEQARNTHNQGTPPSPDVIAKDQRRMEERAILLSSASLDISNRFAAWWSQRRHKIRYHADGDFFRIWIADDLRPDVEIELEARSKGFQWFFSFYLVFLVESEDGHRDSVLLLDEPGLHLHPTAQQELIAFFEKLSEENQLLYSTHSPFLIDGEHLHRVRPVTEDETGHSHISVGTWPKDRETIFPLQAAAGYAMVRGLFRHAQNVLVEGISDYYYLHALSQQCGATNRAALPADIYITPCGGTRHVGHFASLFLAQKVRPLVLLDGDDAGRARRDALLKELYVGHASGVLMLDDVLGRTGEEVEVEDLLGEDIIMPAVRAVFGKAIKLNDNDRRAGSLPSAIKAAAARRGVDLPVWWKASVAIHLVSEWAETREELPDGVLTQAERLFGSIAERFADGH